MTSYLRPDEVATQSEIGRSQKRNENVKSVLKTAMKVVPTGFVASKILPFLSEHITEDVAMKGINKVLPAAGKFLKSGMSQGLSLKSGLDFLKTELMRETDQEKPIESKKTSDQSQNPIERISPALHQFLTQELGKGRKPQEALAVAKVQGHEKDIQNVSKKIGKNLFDIIDQLYGGQQVQSQAALQPEPMQGQQTGQGIDPALLKILEQGNQLLQRFKGPNG